MFLPVFSFLQSKLLDEKRQKWDDYKSEAKDRVKELADVFGNKQPLTRIEKNGNLSQWSRLWMLKNLLKLDDSLLYGFTPHCI